jgi:hypothetical protein
MPFPEPETTLAATIVTEDEGKPSTVPKSRVLEPCKKIYEFSITYTQAQRLTWRAHSGG